MDTENTPQTRRKPLTSTAGTAPVPGARCLVREAGERDVVYQTRPREISRNVILKRRAHDWAREEATR